MGRIAATTSHTGMIVTQRARRERRARRALGAILAAGLATTAITRVAGAAAAADAGAARGAGAGSVSGRTLSPDRYPLQFEANAGQTDPRVAFLSRGPGYTLFLSPSESNLVMTDREGHGAAVRMTLLGASRDARLVPEGAQTGIVNYYIGRDASRWRSGIPAHARVRAAGIYPGVDLVYYGVGRRLEYDFVLAAGADPSRIRLQIEGADAIVVEKDGGLSIGIARRRIRWGKPVVYQQGATGGREPVEGRYVRLGARRVGFQVGRHDARRPLVIDPTLDYATYIGGTDLQVDAEQGQGVAADAAGNAAIAGVTTTTQFPVTAGAYQSTRKGTGNFIQDCFIAKFNATGSGLSFATYFGGTANDQGGSWKMGVAIGPGGDVWAAGFAGGSDFPSTAGSFQPVIGDPNGDAFVARFNATGGLVWSSFLGGPFADRAFCVDVDGSGNAYVGGDTNSGASFPSTPGAYASGGEAFITKIVPDGSSIVYSTTLDTNFARVHGCVVDAAGAVYATGNTGTGTVHMTATPGVFQPTPSSGNGDVFIAKLNPDGGSVAYLTFLGGAGGDDAWDIAVNAQGEAVVAGSTTGSFPVTAGAYQTTFGGAPNNDAFVAKISADASTKIFATYLGKSANDDGRGVGFDDQGRVWVAGNTSSQDFPTTAGAVQGSWNASWFGSPFVALLSADGSALEYGTYLNDNLISIAYDFTTDAGGRAYLTGQALAGFPTTAGAYRTVVGGNSDAFLARFTSGGGGSTDTDGDGVPDANDDCPQVSNADQADADSDGHGNVCDNCPSVANPDQADLDSDGTGDACEGSADADGDGVSDATDNCPQVPNAGQADGDADGRGDACDITLTSPIASAVLDCSDPTQLRPTLSWNAGPYDKFKAFIGRDPNFSTGTANSGDTWLTSTSWTPSGKKWKKACAWAAQAASLTPGGVLYVRIQALDRNAAKNDPARKVYSATTQVTAGF